VFEIDETSIDCKFGSKLVMVDELVECQDVQSGRVTDPKTTYIPNRFAYPIPLEIGSKLGPDNQLTITSEISITATGLYRDAFIATDSTGEYYEVIDKDSGLILLSKYEYFDIVKIWEKSEILETNIFEKKSGIQLEELNIPKWWVKNSKWLIELKITEAEYLNALEYLIGKSAILV